MLCGRVNRALWALSLVSTLQKGAWQGASESCTSQERGQTQALLLPSVVPHIRQQGLSVLLLTQTWSMLQSFLVLCRLGSLKGNHLCALAAAILALSCCCLVLRTPGGQLAQYERARGYRHSQ